MNVPQRPLEEVKPKPVCCSSHYSLLVLVLHFNVLFPLCRVWTGVSDTQTVHQDWGNPHQHWVEFDPTTCHPRHEVVGYWDPTSSLLSVPQQTSVGAKTASTKCCRHRSHCHLHSWARAEIQVMVNWLALRPNYPFLRPKNGFFWRAAHHTDYRLNLSEKLKGHLSFCLVLFLSLSLRPKEIGDLSQNRTCSHTLKGKHTTNWVWIATWTVVNILDVGGVRPLDVGR